MTIAAYAWHFPYVLIVDDLAKRFRLANKGLFGRPKTDARVTDPRHQPPWFHAVRSVSFQVEPGTIVGLLGPNGAGKTTLMRMLSTAIEPTGGTASFAGIDIVKNPLEVRRKLGFLSGTTGLYGRLTAREMITYYGRLHGVASATIATRISEMARNLDMENFLDRRSDTFSAGMKQKVSIARTLIHDPEILIFDEPTTGLDVSAAQTVLGFIEECCAAGKTVVFSTHHMHEVRRLCSQVILIHEGARKFAGTVDEMLQASGSKTLDDAFLKLVHSQGDTDHAA
ncbi:MAG: ATP-binding cassette domain-containing protein [Nannocystaceae bacterium]